MDRQDILSVENSDLSSDETGRQLIAELEDPWLSLILVLLYEYLKGPQSRWKAYFDILPSTFNTLMFWTDDELDLLQASAVREKIGKAGADELLTGKIVGSVRRNGANFPGSSNLSDDEILALAHRMGSTIMAYAFDIEKEPSRQEEDEEGYISDEEDELLPKGMVPMADMLNADADRNNARLEYGESTVAMKALTSIKAGEEIFNDYGPLPRADLLRRYGYITQNYAQYDVVEIPTSLISEHFRSQGLREASEEERFAYLEEYEIYEDGYDIQWPLEDETLFPESLRTMLSVLDLPEDKFKALSSRKPKYVFEEVLPAKALAQYLAVLDKRLGQYSSSADDDRKMLDGMTRAPETEAEARQVMAIRVRLGEKELLLEAGRKVGLALSAIQQATQASNSTQKRQASDSAGGNKKRKLR